jgi:hypothetical protein
VRRKDWVGAPGMDCVLDSIEIRKMHMIGEVLMILEIDDFRG